MDKKQVIQSILDQLEKDLVVLKEAALATYDAATNEESKAENEYDTRGLEASYLAGAQAKRVGEVEELIYIFKNLQIKEFQEGEAIASTALVEVEHKNRRSFFFLMSKGGGVNLKIGSVQIQVVTPSSPLGEALLGLQVGDVALVETGDRTLEYEIISIQ